MSVNFRALTFYKRTVITEVNNTLNVQLILLIYAAAVQSFCVQLDFYNRLSAVTSNQYNLSVQLIYS